MASRYTEIMPIDHIPDWEKRLARQDAFWDREIIDRPVVHITFPENNPDYPFPSEKHWDSLTEKWMDAEYHAEKALAQKMNTAYMGDALPIAWPNLGPQVFSAFFGTPLEFGETTSWTVPNLNNWNEVNQIRFSEDNFYWKKILEMTDIMLEMGRNKFYTGITDLHPGGDAIAAFRDQGPLCIDMIENRENIQSLLHYITDVFKYVIDFYYNKLINAGQAISTWTPIVSTRKWYIPSNDISAMISKEMFDQVFLPGIREECGFLDASIYHLDGPNALQHLDSVLSIEELNALQWVQGARNGSAADWLHIYQRAQQANKGIQITVSPDELETVIKNLRPEGVWMCVNGIKDRETANQILKRIAKWS